MRNDTEWLSAEVAAQRVGISTRQMYRYENRVRTKRMGKRVLFSADDVDELAAELGMLNQAAPPKPKTDLVPAGEMLDYLRQRDGQLQEYQRRLEQAMLELGASKQELGRRQLVDEELSTVRTELETVREERNELRQKMAAIEPERKWLRFLVLFLIVLLVILFIYFRFQP